MSTNGKSAARWCCNDAAGGLHGCQTERDAGWLACPEHAFKPDSHDESMAGLEYHLERCSAGNLLQSSIQVVPVKGVAVCNGGVGGGIDPLAELLHDHLHAACDSALALCWTASQTPGHTSCSLGGSSKAAIVSVGACCSSCERAWLQGYDAACDLLAYAGESGKRQLLNAAVQAPAVAEMYRLSQLGSVLSVSGNPPRRKGRTDGLQGQA